jgi:hypothetical protein
VVKVFKYLTSIVYTLSSTKLEIRTEQILPGSRDGGEWGGEMAQTMHI